MVVFLLHLVLVIAFLLSEVLLQTSFLDIPHTFLLKHALRGVYGPVVGVKPHPYFASGLLFVAITTLLLFFASGMYSEKIAYANRYETLFSIPIRSFPDLLEVTSLTQIKRCGPSTCISTSASLPCDPNTP